MNRFGGRDVRHRLAVAGLVVLVAGSAVSLWWLTRQAVAVHRLTRGVGDTMFYGANGAPWFRLDEQRHDVPLSAISLELQQAIVAVEDRRFYYHPGIDPIAVGRALVRNIRAGRRVEGGSTLTQQLARTLFLTNARTLGRKAKEAATALLMEVALTKADILELYLNRVYLSAGVYGVETMAQHLFRKPARMLTLPEAALIAGLVRAPSALSPWSNYDGAVERSRVVLARMREQGFITPEQQAAAERNRPRVQPYRPVRDTRAGWTKEYLRQQFRDEFGGDHPPDWKVYTTIHPAIQDAAERAVAAGLQRLNRRGLQAALVAMDPSTGNLLAMVGGVDYRQSTFNRATRARRQPGSAFKPLVYAAALEKGYSPVSLVSNLHQVSAPGNPEWIRRNGEGPQVLTLREALLESNNAAAIGLQQQIGSRAVVKLAADAGLNDLPDVPSLALGTGLVSPLELTAAYTVFVGGGRLARPRGILSVVDADGTEVLAPSIQRPRVVSEAVAFQMVSMLRDVVTRGTGASARQWGIVSPVGGKTGTTDDYRDAWFVGFSSAVVAGVWVGFDQPASIGRDAYAARVALPIWADFMKRTSAALPPRAFDVPASLRTEELCSVSYLRPVDGCPTYSEYFKRGDEIPSEACPIHKASFGERAARTVEGLFRTLGRRMAGIFGR